MYRRYRGLLLAEGWQFAALIGPYAAFSDWDLAMPELTKSVKKALVDFETQYQSEVIWIGKVEESDHKPPVAPNP